jgi:nicotinamide-nucleotide amidase
MKAEIITIGDEIIIGQVTDTNSSFIAEELNKTGIEIIRITSVPDNKDSITEALDNAKKKADIIIMTGGLGPTGDDITKNTLAEYFNSTLAINQDVLDRIKVFLSNRSMEITERNIRQAELPDNCRIISNSYGTASGMWFEEYGRIFISLPGVSYEMKSMITNDIIPEFKKRFKLPFIIHKTILTNGMTESEMAEHLKNWESKLPAYIKLAYLPSPGILRLRLSGTGIDKSKIENEIKNQTDKLFKLISDYVFGYDNDRIEEITGKLLAEHNLTVAVAESCTGGKISELITSVPGSSSYFKGSVIAYSNEIKISLLGVSENDIKKYGAVSEEVVKAMAEKTMNLYNTDFAIATSGIAGPSGGTMQKPVGTTWIAVASKDKTIARKFSFGEHRGRNILKASVTALNMLRKHMIKYSMINLNN